MSEVLIYPRSGKPHFVANNWLSLAPGQALPSSGEPVLLPLSVWQALPPEAATRASREPARLGLQLGVSDDVFALEAVLAQGLPHWSLIAVDFPVFRDGRGYSQAAWLRQHLGWQGELRAVGDVLVDQLRAMARVGFDSFALRPDQDRELALGTFEAFAHQMQGDWRAARSQVARPVSAPQAQGVDA